MAANGWNRGRADAPKPKGGRRRNLWLAGAGLALAGAAAVAFLAGRNGEKPTVEKHEQASKMIREVEPAKADAPTNVVEAEDRNSLEWLKKHDSRYIVPEGAYRAANGRLYAPNGRRILEELPARTLYANRGRKRVFQHSAENEIARLLSIEPGKFFVGNGMYNQRFVDSFRESLVTPTLVTKDDTEEEKALKRQVNEVKADLKARMDAGEDICKIMRDTEQELRDLSTYRNDMMKDLHAIRMGQDMSDEDFQTYVDAANKMMKERGLPELKCHKIHESRLKVLRERYQARENEKTNKETKSKE